MSCEHSTSDDCAICSGKTLQSPDRSRSPSTPMEELRTHLEPGQRVGRYAVLEAVGEGGMGVVYAAYDLKLDRRVALKLLRKGGKEASGSDGQARLLREAQAMAQLSHPNVVPVYDVGELEGAVFVAMEFIKGRTLGAWLEDGPRPWAEVLEVFLAAAHGLTAAHDAGLVHRDFKPSNVLVGDDGRVRVTDFGLARAAGAPEDPESVPELGAPPGARA